jgi:DNA polymerase I-like protein with 3'-5' exonuclease and polymerase domains/uracil-DNA glycosylase
MLNPNTFFGTRGNRSGSIMIVGESWGKTEAQKGTCFVGETGQDLERLLFEAGIPISECFFTNVVSARPADNNMANFFWKTKEAHDAKTPSYKGCYPQQIVYDGIQTLKQQIESVKPKLIIGLGAYALWALTDTNYNISDAEGYKIPSGISNWRGSQLYVDPYYGQKIPFLPTYHPAAALQGSFAWRYMIRHDLKARARKILEGKSWDEPSYDFIIQPSFDTATSYLVQLLRLLDRGPTEVCLDLETSISRQIISCVGLSYIRGSALCIPLLSSLREDGYWSLEEEFQIVQLLRQILSHPNLRLIGHNLLFDAQFIIDQLWVRPRIYFDTMLGQHTLWPGGGDPSDRSSSQNIAQGIQRKALYNCASLYCDHYYYWKDEGKDFDEVGLRDELTGWKYNCRDIIKTFEVYDEEKQLLKQFQLEEQFAFQMEIANDFALEMMVNGVKVNRGVKEQTNRELEEALQQFDERLIALIPEEIRTLVEPKTFKKDKKTGKKVKTQWPTSSTQQKAIFHDIMGIQPVLVRQKSGKNKGEKKITLDKNALPILAEREPIIAPIVERLETRRSIGVFQSTFGESEEEPDGRLRCEYAVAGTDTFRFASRKNVYGRGGNFQNIPSGKEKGLFHFPNMRRYFEPDVGYELAEYDQSGADATIVAWEADDEELKEAFRQGKKIHLVNTRTLFPQETKDMTDDEIKAGNGIPGSYYDSVKKGVHATNYGAEPATLSHRLKWTLSKSEEFQERWFTSHPGILKWQMRTEFWLNGLQCWKCNSMTNAKSLCPTCGAQTGRTVSNKFGYRIVYFDRMNDLKKKALAWVPQSSVAINVNKGAMAIKKHPKLEGKVKFLLQVHDSLVVQYPIQYANSIQQDIKQALHSVSVPYADPLVIQWSAKASRKSWGDAEKIDW